MKILFMGTPEFAVPGLDKIVRRGIVVPAVITRPDRPAGRGKQSTPPPVKEAARALGLDVIQPEKLNDPALIDTLKELRPDLIVVSAYGKLIPPTVLACAGGGGINLHPSLLPRYRGAAPVQWTLINGDTETGVSVISVSEQMDAGDIYAQKTVPVLPEDNAATLARRLAREGGELLADVVEMIARGNASPRPQNEDEITFAPRLTKEDGWINWNEPAEQINNRIRGLYPWPGTFTTIPSPKGVKTVKLLRSQPLPEGGEQPGIVLKAEKDRLIIAAGEGSLRVHELQVEGKRPLAADAFLRGHPIPPGTILGERP